MDIDQLPGTIGSRADLDRMVQRLLALDSDLAPLASATGELPLRLHEPGFAGLVRIILGQQVSQASATAVYNRLVSEISPLTPENFMARGLDAWVRVGLTRPRQRTIEQVCAAILDGRLALQSLPGLQAKDAIAILTSVKGIGPWSAEVYLMFCEGHADIFPAGDLALKEAVRMWLGLEARPDEAHMRDIASRWKPLRSVAARLFWAYYKILKS